MDQDEEIDRVVRNVEYWGQQSTADLMVVDTAMQHADAGGYMKACKAWRVTMTRYRKARLEYMDWATRMFEMCPDAQMQRDHDEAVAGMEKAEQLMKLLLDTGDSLS